MKELMKKASRAEKDCIDIDGMKHEIEARGKDISRLETYIYKLEKLGTKMRIAQGQNTTAMFIAQDAWPVK